MGRYLNSMVPFETWKQIQFHDIIKIMDKIGWIVET